MGPQADRSLHRLLWTLEPGAGLLAMPGFQRAAALPTAKQNAKTLWRTKESGSESLWETSLHASCDKKLTLSEDNAQDGEAILPPEHKLQPRGSPWSRAWRPAHGTRSVSAAPAVLVSRRCFVKVE